MAAATSIATTARARSLDTLERERFDCVIIGGGITGAGVAREAVLHGLRVALLEAEDFASGTSSRSSKLIHGGLRYLALGDVALVRETALERKEIFRLAPHLAERRWLVVPARSRASMLKFRMGIAAYERLGAVEDQDLHQNWGEAELAQNEPLLDRSRYPHACAYREYLTDDARLVLANLRAAAGDGALVLNHARVTSVLREGESATGIEAVCGLTGRSVRVRARSILNAAGPWVEGVRKLEDPRAQPLLVLSKGIHVVLPHERIPLRNMIILSAPDARSLFAIPRGRVVYLGTTDTLYSNVAEVWPAITQDDVEYLLEPVPRHCAVEPIKVDEVLAAWAGLRPLIAESGKKTTEISRRDELLVGPGGVLTVAGGKLTGYRPMARRVLAMLAEQLHLKLGERRAEAPLPGGDFDGDLDALASRLAREAGFSGAVALRLARLYGTESREVVRRGAEPLVPGASVLRGEVDWAVQEEGAARLEDWIYRRTRTALFEPLERDAVLGPGAERMASLLGWDSQTTQSEIARVRALLASELAFARPMP